jgi:hypothetical protein
MKGAILLLCCTAAFASCGDRLHFDGEKKFDLANLPEEMSFADWRAAFGKAYASRDELQHRTRIFEANLDFIRRHNNGTSTFRMGVNQFTDLNQSEFKERVVPAQFPPPDAPHNVKWLPVADDLAAATIDWRTKGAVTPVKNQVKNLFRFSPCFLFYDVRVFRPGQVRFVLGFFHHRIR